MRELKTFEVSIIGVGNIGFRYYQAILEINCVRKINLIDKKIEYIEKRISSINPLNKEISITSSLSFNLLKSDLIIISTTSLERYEICKELQYLGYKGKLILEKFLFPNEKTLSNAEILLLDESTSNLDDKSRNKIFEVWEEQKLTIINSTHDPNKFRNVSSHYKIEIVGEKRVLEKVEN